MPQPAPTRVEAPEDGFVERLAIAGPLAAGAFVASIRSPSLERRFAKVDDFTKQIEIAERPFHDGRVAQEIQAIVAKAALLQSIVNENVVIETAIKEGIRVGSQTQADLSLQMTKSYQAQSALIDAKLAADQATQRKADMLDRLDAAKMSLSQQKIYLQEIQNGLTIKTPAAGIFEPLVLTGDFVKKGHLIGTLTL